MTLRELQERFQAGVLDGLESGGGAILDWLKDSPRMDRGSLFGVYVGAYRLRLAEFVANDFPVLRDHIGDEAFGSLVEDFISSAPSRHRNARWYASGLPEFMREHAQWRTDRIACDLALFERTLADAFDSADTPALTIAALAATEAEDWPRLVFAFHPSLAMLDLSKGVARLFDALSEGADSEPADSAEDEAILVWRRNDEPVYRKIVEDERLALMEARAGKSFGDICALLAFQNDQALLQRAAGILAQWFADGLVTDISLSE